MLHTTLRLGSAKLQVRTLPGNIVKEKKAQSRDDGKILLAREN